MKAHQVRGESCWENGRGGGQEKSPRQQRLHDSYYCSEHDSCTDGARHTEGSNLTIIANGKGTFGW